MKRIKKGLLTGTAMTAGLGTSVSAFTFGNGNEEVEEIVPKVEVETQEETTNSWWDHAPQVTDGTITEEMDFAQAFAAARKELGAGGVFTWHDQLFSTFYKEECDADGNPLPEFLQNEGVEDSLTEDHDETTTTTKEDKDAKNDAAEKSDKVEEETADEDKKDLTDQPEGEVKDEMRNLEKEDVNILSMDSDGDGYAEKVYVDVNKDGTADILMDDSDGNGMVDKDEVMVLDEEALAAGAVKGNASGDVLMVDYSGDGIVDTQIIDVTGDGVADQMAQDLDQDGKILADNDVQIDIQSDVVDGSLADNQSFGDKLNDLAQPVELVAEAEDPIDPKEDEEIEVVEVDEDSQDLLADASDDEIDDDDDDLFS